jgi:PTS system mannose-specific IIA component|tara:strand:- start:29 stop:436 length:408 start_codon:yes stop_codon:yes gene_type:complete
MIGIIIITHGNLALELKAAMEHVIGLQKNTEIISINPDDDLETKKGDIAKSIKKADNNSGIIILTDMFGGTPSNLAITFLIPEKIEIISGVNLPMLVKIAELRDSKNLLEVIGAGKDAGQKYISIASEILSENIK